MPDWTLTQFARNDFVAGSTAYLTQIESTTPNVKGSYVQIVASTAFDADGFILEWSPSNGIQVLLDIAIGAAGSEQVILSNCMAEAGPNAPNDSFGICYIPLPIPAGTRIAARCQASAVSGAAEINARLILLQGGYNGIPNLSLGKAATYGADTSDSGGTQIDPGGVANTKGAWVEISASTGEPIKWMLVFIGLSGNQAAAWADFKFDIGTGGAGSETVLIEDIQFSSNGTTFNHNPVVFSIPGNIPAGSRVAVRGQTSTTDATDRLFDVVLIGIY